MHRTGIAPRKDLPDPMSDQSTASPATASPPAAAGGPGVLRVIALAAVGIGLAALAGAACVLSYGGIHAFALDAGIRARLARGYPLIFDVLLVVILAAVLALRGAGLPSKVLAWTCLLALLSAAAGADALHAAGRKLPAKEAAVTAAIVPWVLVLVAFALLLAMLRQARLRRLAENRVTGRGRSRAGWEPQRKPPASALPLVPGFEPGELSSAAPVPRPAQETVGLRQSETLLAVPTLVVAQQVKADSAVDAAGPGGRGRHPAGEMPEAELAIDAELAPDDPGFDEAPVSLDSDHFDRAVSEPEDSSPEDSGPEDSGPEDSGPEDGEREDSGAEDSDREVSRAENSGPEDAEEGEPADPEMPVFHRMWSSPVPPAGE